jgi:hypothetical protein
MSSVAQLVAHVACDARVVGLIPKGDKYKKKKKNEVNTLTVSCSG